MSGAMVGATQAVTMKDYSQVLHKTKHLESSLGIKVF